LTQEKIKAEKLKLKEIEERVLARERQAEFMVLKAELQRENMKSMHELIEKQQLIQSLRSREETFVSHPQHMYNHTGSGGGGGTNNCKH
jgi:hypothetical protein